MPIYEYQCQKCGTRIEKRQSISDEPLTVCENCGGHLEKQVSLSGFQFKGGGWYVTDYAAKKDSPAERAGDKPDGGVKTEKTSPAESTATPDGASNKKSDAPSVAKADSTAKKE